MELTNEVSNSLCNYFSLLSKTGYKPDVEVNSLLVFLFIEELLTGPIGEYITEEDYNNICKSLQCLYGSCMIPYPEYKNIPLGITQNKLYKYRITEEDKLRTSEDNYLRMKA